MLNIACRIVSYLSEANGDADDATDRWSAVSLCIGTAASPVHLHEHEILCRHHSVRRVHSERREYLVGERIVDVMENCVGRAFHKVWKQCHMCAWSHTALGVCDFYTVHLKTKISF